MKQTKYIAAISLLALLSLAITSCNPYKKVQVTTEAFYGMKNFNKNFDKYVYIIHTPDSLTYSMDVDTLSGDSLMGSVSAIDKSSRVVPSKKEKRSQVHLFLLPSSEKNEILANNTSEELVISTKDVAKVEMNGKKRMGILGVLLTILLGIVGLFALLIAIVIGVLISDGGNGSSSSSGTTTGGSGSSCYIATMAYGDINAPEVNSLRRFRDNILVNYKVGRQFINWYYANAPDFVAKHESKLWLHTLCRNLLNPFVSIINKFIK